MSAESYAPEVTLPAHLEVGVANFDPGPCPFCVARQGGSDSPFDRILASGLDASLVPALGMLVPGYLLVVANDHVLSFAEFGAERLTRFARWLTPLVGGLGIEFGDYIVVEHGSCSGTPSGACIDHAHAHLVPLAGDLRDALLEAAPWTRLEHHSDLAEYQGIGYTYLGVASDKYVTTSKLPSQWIRRIVAAHLGHDRWDWALDAGLGNLSETLARITLVSAQSAARIVP